jgi:hypothetical protein
MRKMIAALAVAGAGLAFAVSAQAAPSTSLAPLSTLSQSSIEHVQYRPKCGYGYSSARVCKGYGEYRKCSYVCKKH